MEPFKLKGSHHHHHHHRRHFHPSGPVVFIAVLAACLTVTFGTLFSTGFIQKKFLERALVSVDLSQITNTDYLLDASQPLPSKDSQGPFTGLSDGTMEWRRILFQLPSPYQASSRWSIYTSCKNSKRSFAVDLDAKPSRNLYILVAGCQVDSKEIAPVAEVKIHYTDDSWERKVLKLNVDVWPAVVKDSSEIPPGQLVWQGVEGGSITGVVISLNPQKTPSKVDFTALGAPTQAGVTLFAAVQETRHLFETD